MAGSPGAVITNEPPQNLTAQDRCDAAAAGKPCGAKAYARAALPSGGYLLFCGHHLRQHTAALAAAGAEIHDYTSEIPS